MREESAERLVNPYGNADKDKETEAAGPDRETAPEAELKPSVSVSSRWAATQSKSLIPVNDQKENRNEVGNYGSKARSKGKASRRKEDAYYPPREKKRSYLHLGSNRVIERSPLVRQFLRANSQTRGQVEEGGEAFLD